MAETEAVNGAILANIGMGMARLTEGMVVYALFGGISGNLTGVGFVSAAVGWIRIWCWRIQRSERLCWRCGIWCANGFSRERQLGNSDLVDIFYRAKRGKFLKIADTP